MDLIPSASKTFQNAAHSFNGCSLPAIGFAVREWHLPSKNVRQIVCMPHT